MGDKKRLGSEISENMSELHENMKKQRRDEEHDASIKSKLGESHMNERATQAKEISRPGWGEYLKKKLSGFDEGVKADIELKRARDKKK